MLATCWQRRPNETAMRGSASCEIPPGRIQPSSHASIGTQKRPRKAQVAKRSPAARISSSGPSSTTRSLRSPPTGVWRPWGRRRSDWLTGCAGPRPRLPRRSWPCPSPLARLLEAPAANGSGRAERVRTEQVSRHDADDDWPGSTVAASGPRPLLGLATGEPGHHRAHPPSAPPGTGSRRRRPSTCWARGHGSGASLGCARWPWSVRNRACAAAIGQRVALLSLPQPARRGASPRTVVAFRRTMLGGNAGGSVWSLTEIV